MAADGTRGAKRQVLMREVNQRIVELLPEAAAGTVNVLCECVHDDCSEWLSLVPGEYRDVRRHPRRFAVRADHVAAEVERVVHEDEGFVVVEKIGEAGGIAADAYSPSAD